MNKPESRLKKIQLCLLAFLACLSFTLPLFAIPLSNATDVSETKVSVSKTFETDNRGVAEEKMFKFARPKILLPEGMQADDMVYKPFIFWRAWVHQKMPFVRVVWAMILTLTPLTFIFRRTLAGSVENYQRGWLKCFGIGIGSVTFALIVEATIARMGLFVHLSICILAIVEFLAAFGLAVAAQSLGASMLSALKLTEKPANPIARTILTVWAGIFLLSLLVLLPNIGVLQELGNRMLALIAATGAGAVIMRIHSLSAGEEREI